MRNILRMRRLPAGGMRLVMAVSLVSLALLAGCASRGLLESPGLSDSFSVATDPDSAYRRALEYVRICHKSRPHPYGAVYNSLRDADELPDDSDFDILSTGRAKEAPKKVDQGRIRVYKVGEEAKIIELFSAKLESTTPAVSTRMTVSVIGSGIWDKAELAAARQSIVSATPVCRPVE